MSVTSLYLPSNQPRARWKRLDTAQILKRFFFCERALIIGASNWVPHIARLDLKLMIPLFCWQNAKTADALRERVFELRYPSRMMDHEGADKPLGDLLLQLREAPSEKAFWNSLLDVALPALRDAYQEFLDHSDPLADAPTYRFLELSLREKNKQIEELKALVAKAHPDADSQAGQAWTEGFSKHLADLGGVGTDRPPSDRLSEPLRGGHRLEIPDKPARDPRYWPCRFYWPDIVDSNFPYGEGLRLQLRSAVSHVNEVWAVEHGAIILAEFADILPWEWISDVARWTYDESRHCLMGAVRLKDWGFAESEIPLGTYIYESAKGGEPIHRLGMLYFFETKNIGRKPERTAAFKEIGDAASEHDMDFDWADETIHATYGNRWIKALHELNPEKFPPAEQVRRECEERVRNIVSTASEEEKRAINDRAHALIQRGEEIARQR